MLATAIGVDGTIEADVRRLIEGEDRLGVLLRNRGAQLRWFAVERRDVIAPVTVRFARGQAEARWRRSRLRPAAPNDGIGHGRILAAFHEIEHSRNIITAQRLPSVKGQMPADAPGAIG